MKAEFEMIKRYRNGELWVNYSPQDGGGFITHVTFTEVGIAEEGLRNYRFMPAFFLSGKSLDECKGKVREHGHKMIMRQLLGAY